MNKGVPGFFAQVGALIRRGFNKISKMIDKIIYEKRLRAVVSFLVAVLICFSLYFNELSLQFFQSDVVTQSLGNIPVEVQIDSDVYEVTGMPETVAATATGPSAEIRVLINQNTLAVVADLRNLSEGQNEIDLKASNVPENVEVTLNPDSAVIDIERKIRRSFIVEPEMLYGPSQNAETFERPSLARSSVTIVGTRQKIDSIRTVKAIIDASGHTTDFTIEALVVPYDTNGKQVTSVEVIPSTIEATITLAPKEEEVQETQDTQNGNATDTDAQT